MEHRLSLQMQILLLLGVNEFECIHSNWFYSLIFICVSLNYPFNIAMDSVWPSIGAKQKNRKKWENDVKKKENKIVSRRVLCEGANTLLSMGLLCLCDSNKTETFTNIFKFFFYHFASILEVHYMIRCSILLYIIRFNLFSSFFLSQIVIYGEIEQFLRS